MSKKLKTNVIFILDKSGSMSNVARSTVVNFNEQVQQMKENSKEQDITCSLITFNGDVFEHLWNVNASDIEEVDENGYETIGGTALYDAIGYAINKTKQTFEGTKDIAHLVYILSDGEENSSKKYSQQILSNLIKECDAEGNWTFSYMGCTKEQVESIVKAIDIPITNCAVWSNQNEYSARRSMTKSANSMDGFYKSRASGQCVTRSLYSTSGMQDFSESSSNSADLDNTVQSFGFTPDLYNNIGVVNTTTVAPSVSTKRGFSSSLRSRNLSVSSQESCCDVTSNKSNIFKQGTKVVV